MLRFIFVFIFTLFPIVANAQGSERTIAVDHPGKMVLIRTASGDGEIERVFMPVPSGQDAVSVTNNFTLLGLPVPQMFPLDLSTIVSALDDPTTALVIGAFDTNNPVLDPVFASDVAVYVFENRYALQPTMLTRGSQAITSGSTVVPVEGPNQTVLVLNGSIDQPIRTILYPPNTSATGLNDWLGPAGLSTVPLLIYDSQTASRLGEPQIGLITGSSTFANPANDNILQTSSMTKVYTVRVSAFLLDVTPAEPATIVTSQAPDSVPLPVPATPPAVEEELVVVPDPVPTPTTPVDRAQEIETPQVEPEQVTVADAPVTTKGGLDEYIVHADFGVTVFVSYEMECTKPTLRILTNNTAFLSAVERNRTRQFFDAALKPIHRYCEHLPDEYVPFNANVFLDDVQIAVLTGKHSFLMPNSDPVDVSVTVSPEITNQPIYESYWSQYPKTRLDEETLKALSDQGIADASFALAVSYKTADYSQQTYFAVPGLFSALEINDVYFERAIEQGFPTAPHFRFLSILDRATADQRRNPGTLPANERDQLVLSIAQSVQRGTLDGELTRRYADSRGLPINDVLVMLQSRDPRDADLELTISTDLSDTLSDLQLERALQDYVYNERCVQGGFVEEVWQDEAANQAGIAVSQGVMSYKSSENGCTTQFFNAATIYSVREILQSDCTGGANQICQISYRMRCAIFDAYQSRSSPIFGNAEVMNAAVCPVFSVQTHRAAISLAKDSGRWRVLQFDRLYP